MFIEAGIQKQYILLGNKYVVEEDMGQKKYE
jgi:hypothetical protein